MNWTIVCLIVGAAAGTSPPAPSGSRVERPRSRVEWTVKAGTGTSRTLRGGGDLQQALDAAQPGDTIVLEAGATFRGPFRLPNKPGADWITIRTDVPDASLPAAGERAHPNDAALMPKLESSSQAVIQTAPGAHHFRFLGLEIRPQAGSFLLNLVDLGTSGSSAEGIPHHIVFERCYIHGDPRVGARRGIALNAADSAVVDSYLSDLKERGADTQAIACWNGPGPLRIENNHLEGAGENVMFGGADPTVRDLVPSDIEVLRNHLVKPLSWKVGEPDYAGVPWTVKNLFELKSARRVTVEGNVLENNWAEAQTGYAVLFTVRNQDGGAPWSVVEDVHFANNVVRHTASAINILGRDDLQPAQGSRRIAIENNLFDDVGNSRWGGGGTFLMILDGAADVSVVHNTALNAGNPITAEGAPHTGFIFRDNIALMNRYGIVGTGTASGAPTLNTYFPGSMIRKNALVGGRPGEVPADNFAPVSLDELGFVDWHGGDYRLQEGSKYHRAASDGTDVGVDMTALSKALGPPPREPPPSAPPHPAPNAGGLAEVGGGPLGPVSLAFWTAVLLLAYTHVGYPLLVQLLALVSRRRTRRKPIEPSLSVVIVVHNEAGQVGGRIENALALDYPRERLEIIVASDGSTDGTVARASAYERAGVKVIDFAQRRGKASVLNEVVPRCMGEIVVLADARQRFGYGALRALVARFADPRVGAASGELILTQDGRPGSVAQGMGFYWRFEKAIRAAESRLDSTVGVTGAIYALRRELFELIPTDTLLDDVLVPLRMVRRGYRVVFEPGAKAYEPAPRQAAGELARKVRTIAGTFQLFARERWLLDPWRNRLFLQTVSHKGLRLLTPLLLAVAFAADLLLARDDPWHRWTLAAQVLFYLAALCGFVLRDAGRRFPLVAVPYVFCLLAWATVLAFVRFLRGRQPVTWDRVAPAPGAP